MKAFLVGLLFLVLMFVLIVVMSGLFVLLSPFLLMIGIALRVILSIVVVIFAIWLLGKLIIYIWDSLRSKGSSKSGTDEISKR
ncbi:MAG: hypothetical protein JW800_07895 [Candidatus Omnitrophica bacterium]|nr:hypothetical protein [Candidatus Omnitrophota bacterium]